MDRELKQRWLAALRGGEYQQARGQLRSDSGFCCLGVLCDLLNPKGWTQSAFQLTPGAERTYCVLPWEFQTKVFPNDGLIIDHLVALNDDGKTFAEIADVIEKEL